MELTQIPKIYKYMKEQESITSILELPIKTNEDKIYPITTVKYQFLSIFHWKNLVNGFSGFIPKNYQEDIEALSLFPDVKSLAILSLLGVRHVLLHSEDYAADKWDKIQVELSKKDKYILVKKEGPDFLYSIESKYLSNLVFYEDDFVTRRRRICLNADVRDVLVKSGKFDKTEDGIEWGAIYPIKANEEASYFLSVIFLKAKKSKLVRIKARAYSRDDYIRIFIDEGVKKFRLLKEIREFKNFHDWIEIPMNNFCGKIIQLRFDLYSSHFRDRAFIHAIQVFGE